MAEQKPLQAGYRRIAELLEQKIESGTYPVGSTLPSYTAIAAEYDVSMNVARDAVGSLGKRGIVSVAPGIGTTVLRRPSDTPAHRDIPTRLADVDAAVQRMSEQLDDEIKPDLATIQGRLDDLQNQVIELYGRIGAEYPHQKPAAARQRKAGGKGTRSA